MLSVCRGIVLTVEALREVDPDALIAHVDATDLYVSEDPGLAFEVAHRQQIVFLALDLVSGRVDRDHPLRAWLLRLGATEADLAWFVERAVDLPLIGLNLYPLFTRKILVKGKNGLRTRMPYASAAIIDRLVELYHRRYQRPLFISETASSGSVLRRSRWLDDSVAAVARVRERGIPLVGYTWWPLFALVTWGYRQGRLAPSAYIRQMGLWDLRSIPNDELSRVPTELVDRYRALCRGGTEAVGRLAAMESVHVP
jgi:beta-glucosidase